MASGLGGFDAASAGLLEELSMAASAYASQRSGNLSALLKSFLSQAEKTEAIKRLFPPYRSMMRTKNSQFGFTEDNENFAKTEVYKKGRYKRHKKRKQELRF